MKPWERKWNPEQEVRQQLEGAATLPWQREWKGMNPVTFEDAADRVLKAEGGWSNDPDDKGGLTRFGISQAAYPKLDLSTLTEQDALNLYKKDYWDRIGAEDLPPEIRAVAFDSAINHGAGWTRKALRQLQAEGGGLEEFIAMRERKYSDIVAADPSQKKFLQGWLNRLNKYRPAERKPWEVNWGD